MLPAGAGGQDGEALVAVLEAVAVRACVRGRAPHAGEAGDVGHLVEHPGGEQDRPRDLDPARRAEPDDAVAHRGPVDLGAHDLDAVAGELRAAAGAQIRGIDPVVAEHAVHLVGGVVARPGVVEHDHAPARAAEHERGVETGRSGADDDAIPRAALRPAGHRLVPSSLTAHPLRPRGWSATRRGRRTRPTTIRGAGPPSARVHGSRAVDQLVEDES